MAAPKTKKVKCDGCKKESAILATSVEKDRPTIWQCPDPECATKNSIDPK